MVWYNASKKQSFSSFGSDLDLSASLQRSERWGNRSATWTQAQLHSHHSHRTVSGGAGRTTGGAGTKKNPNTICFQQNIFSGSRKRQGNLAITHKKDIYSVYKLASFIVSSAPPADKHELKMHFSSAQNYFAMTTWRKGFRFLLFHFLPCPFRSGFHREDSIYQHSQQPSC